MDVYFHVPINPEHQHFLHFVVSPTETYQFWTLPFSLSSAPRIFMMVLRDMARFVHCHGINLILIMIALWWPNQLWFLDLPELSVNHPVELPVTQTLLSQPVGGGSSSPPLLTSRAHPDCLVFVQHALRGKGLYSSSNGAHQLPDLEFHLCHLQCPLDEVVLLVPGTRGGSVTSHCSLSDKFLPVPGHPALASIFKYLDCSVFDGPGIAALLKNFTPERPLLSQVMPQWSLPLVLSFLKGGHFEPLQEASLEALTRKIIFLTVFVLWEML